MLQFIRGQSTIGLMRGKLNRRTVTVLAIVALAAVALNAGPMLSRRQPDGDKAAVLGWGANNFGQAGNGRTGFEAIDPQTSKVDLPEIRQLALGLNHSLALTADGKVYAWGANQYGQIGQSTTLAQRPVPDVVKGLPETRQVAANQDHSLALAKDGSVWSWGLNMSGQLGDGSGADRAVPKPVEGLSDVRQVAAGYRMSLALREDGGVWAWGADCQAAARGEGFLGTVELMAAGGAYAELGTAGTTKGTYTSISPEEDCINEEVVNIKSRRPKPIGGLPKVESISAGFGHMMAVDRTGQLWTWGCNTYGQVGNGVVGRGDGSNLRPAKVAGMTDVAAVSAGYRHSLVLKRDGTVWAWGHNYMGELGNGREEDENPVAAKVAGLPRIASISAGHDFSVAVTPDGALWGWGNGEVWQFGKDKQVYRTPHRIWEMVRADKVVAGGGHVAALARPETNQERIE